MPLMTHSWPSLATEEHAAPTPRAPVPPYLWIVMEIGYLCRLRGVETITLTDAHAHEEGLHTNRRKRSRDSMVEWSPRLNAAWEAAITLRQSVIDRHALPVQLRAEHRFLILAQYGEPIQKSSLDSAWQRSFR